MKVRPGIENEVKTLSANQRIALDEFLAILVRKADSGSIYRVLEECIEASSLEYIQEVISIQEYILKQRKTC